MTYYNKIILSEPSRLLAKKKGPPVRPRGNRGIEQFQREGWDALRSGATHLLFAGGARSGKTYLIMKAVIIRALAAPESTHAVLRFRFNHLKASIINDTMPAVCKREWPGEFVFFLNRSDWFAEFRNGARIYFGGLDDKDRTEKILGQGHSTIFNNEISQISYASRNKAVTRLSQNNGLRLLEINDENPPLQGHWSYKLWIEKRDPSTGQPLPNAEKYKAVFMQPANNPHIPEATKDILRALPPRERVRFWEGKFGEAIDNALWTYESIERSRTDELPTTLVRIIIAIDPSGSHGEEDKRSDEVGIVVAAIDKADVVYILEDASGRIGPNGPDGWAELVSKLFVKWAADCVIAETNFGGAMVEAVIKSHNPDIPFKEVTATRGKAVRAEPVATLFDNGRIKLAGTFPELEEQMLQFSSAGYKGDKSPDRADAMVWAVTELAVDLAPGVGLLEWYKRQAAAINNQGAPQHRIAGKAPPPEHQFNEMEHLANKNKPAPPVVEADTVLLYRKDVSGTYFAKSGLRYSASKGHIRAKRKDMQELLDGGFKIVPEPQPQGMTP